MNEKSKGVLIFSEWFEALEKLSARDYKRLVSATYQYQIHDVQPPEFEGKAAILASMIFPCIEKRKRLSAIGKMGIEARLSKLNSKSADADGYANGYANNEANSYANSHANSYANNEANSYANSYADSQRIEKNSKEKYSIEERSIEELTLPLQEADLTEETRAEQDARDARQERGEILGYGTYGNVLLSEAEYQKIKGVIPEADRYIDSFSQKLHDKGYRYVNHADAILSWWKRDRESGYWRDTEEQIPRAQIGSFDTDSFFEAAVRKSLGEG